MGFGLGYASAVARFGRLTAAGLDFVRRMSETATAWRDEPISAQARAFAARESGRHLAHWERTNGPVPA